MFRLLMTFVLPLSLLLLLDLVKYVIRACSGDVSLKSVTIYMSSQLRPACLLVLSLLVAMHRLLFCPCADASLLVFLVFLQVCRSESN